MSPSDVPELSSSDRAIDLIKLFTNSITEYSKSFIASHSEPINFEISVSVSIKVAVISNLEELDIKDAERFLRSNDF